MSAQRWEGCEAKKSCNLFSRRVHANVPPGLVGRSNMPSTDQWCKILVRRRPFSGAEFVVRETDGAGGLIRVFEVTFG